MCLGSGMVVGGGWVGVVWGIRYSRGRVVFPLMVWVVLRVVIGGGGYRYRD